MNFLSLVSKALRRLGLAALRRCRMDSRARVLNERDLTDVVMGRYSTCDYGCRITGYDIGVFCSIADDVSTYKSGAGATAREISTWLEEQAAARLEMRWWDWWDQRSVELGESFPQPEELLKLVVSD